MEASSRMILSAGSSCRPKSHQVLYSKTQIPTDLANSFNLHSTSSFFGLAPLLILSLFLSYQNFDILADSGLTTVAFSFTFDSDGAMFNLMVEIDTGEEEMSHWNCILSDDRSSTAQWHTLRTREECDQVRYVHSTSYDMWLTRVFWLVQNNSFWIPGALIMADLGGVTGRFLNSNADSLEMKIQDHSVLFQRAIEQWTIRCVTIVQPPLEPSLPFDCPLVLAYPLHHLLPQSASFYE